MGKIVELNGVQYFHSQDMGFARMDRLKFALDNGLLKRDEEKKDYILTIKAIREYTNFFQWLQGNADRLISVSEIFN